MSIWQKAYETYDNHAHLAGEYIEGKEPLSPICHMVSNAQIEISLKADGSFVGARQLSKEKGEGRTIIPVTEDSADRGGNMPNAHPLSDQLRYVSSVDAEKFRNYADKIAAWSDSEYSTPKVDAVRKYIDGGTILRDLEESGIIKLNEEMTFANGKIAEKNYSECIVRWRVYGSGDVDECWKDPVTLKAWEDYYLHLLSNQREKCFCIVSGKQDILTSKHPRAIVQSSYGAKLISQKDADRRFAYKGRFLEAEQAATVGFVSSQKIHCALRWLVANEGVTVGKKDVCSIVCWNPHGKSVMKPTDDPFANEDESELPIEPSEYRQLLYNTIGSYKNQLPDDDVCIAAFEAATTGRLSITYYSEKRASDYYKRIEKWYSTACFLKRSEGSKYVIRTPKLFDIVKCAYGVERGSFLEVDDKLFKEQVKRLLPCITESSPIPLDVVHYLHIKASQPQNYDDKKNKDKKHNYNLVLYTACAVIRKYHNDISNKEEWTMQLDTAKNDRSYLFGRLLAVMEYTERCTYDSGETREPNAVRMHSVFCERPLHTAAILKERLVPYMQKLYPAKRQEMEDLISDIFAAFREEDDAVMNRHLDDTYLLGYYLQRKELYKSKKDKETNLTESEDKENVNP
ncbi:MAG: type I-C CRISPR-associated protein Cas8c/Csd1 [Firmicutes bacterium]|nr:type I-C CRISPR-associated protein Cas8c/Csd1 [Bacillota bacterium]